MNKIVNVLISLIFCITILTFTACGNKVNEKEKEKSSDIAVSTKDDIFELKMYIDKNTYTQDQVIKCYATLEYIGEEDSITVYSADPLVGFSIKDDKYFDGEYNAWTILKTTTLEKGEIVRFDYAKSGGWSAEDPNADFYKNFYSEKELILPIGKYEISTMIACSLDEADGPKYNKLVSADIIVNQ